MATPQEKQNQQIEIKGVKIRFPNFVGRGDRFNREGARNFVITLLPEEADRLKRIGFNVRTAEGREEGDQPEHRLKINVQFQTAGRKPRVHMYVGGKRTPLNEDTVELLDDSRILKANVRFRPFFYDEEDPNRCSAYLVDLYVQVEGDDLADDFETADTNDMEDPGW